jgi:hypothetical protein
MGIAILYPVLAQIVLTLVMALLMGRARWTALGKRDVTVDQIALDNSRWPAHSRKYANCYSNQFELPVLFYVLCLITQITRTADIIFVVLAWLFVASRVLHAYIHTTSNVVRSRGAAFGIGYIVVVIMTVFLLFRLVLPPTA